MIVNEQDPHSRAMFWELERRAPSDVPVYQQSPLQSDVWEALDGDKDDFLIYDRWGPSGLTLMKCKYSQSALQSTYSSSPGVVN